MKPLRCAVWSVTPFIAVLLASVMLSLLSMKTSPAQPTAAKTQSMVTVTARNSAETVTINGVKYKCPANSILMVSPSGKTSITPLTGYNRTKSTTFISRSHNTVRGTGNTLNGANNTVYGNGNTINGNKNVLAGFQNTVSGSNDIVSGGKNQVSGGNDVVAGDKNTVSGSSNTLSSSGQTVLGSNQTIVKPHIPVTVLAALTRKENVNTVNGTKYKSPVGSVITVTSDGKALITFPK